MRSILNIFKKKEQKVDRVSEFFRHTSKEEKVRVLREVAKEASDDQRRLLREYDKRLGTMRAR
ncbi:MAG: hypothetical protein PHT88_00225 [Candidatus Moranbacteria bacterium]|nr:hypothetical protein [Candidatus Moranbacteria bacterium]